MLQPQQPHRFPKSSIILHTTKTSFYLLFSACTASHIVNHPYIDFVTAWEPACSQCKETHELLCKTVKRKSAISGSGLWPLLSTQVCRDLGCEGGSSSALQIWGLGYWDTFLWEKLERRISQTVVVNEKNTHGARLSLHLFTRHLLIDLVLGFETCLWGCFSNRDIAVGATLSASWHILCLLKSAVWCRAALALCLRVLPSETLALCSDLT